MNPARLSLQVLSSFQVTGLFAEEEMKNYAASMDHEASGETDFHKSFSERVSKNVKVVASFSCANSELRERLRANPVIAQKCLYKSLAPWNEETLERIAHVHLRSLPDADSNQISGIIATMIKMHFQGCSSEKAAARRFIAFVKLSYNLAMQTRTKTANRIEFLQVHTVHTL